MSITDFLKIVLFGIFAYIGGRWDKGQNGFLYGFFMSGFLIVILIMKFVLRLI